MTKSPPVPVPSVGAQIRLVRHDLVSARDAQIAQVVAMVDRLPQRGDADALIAPLRPRLAELRPDRPVSFTRMLFAPLDPMIVPSAKWRRDSLTVPRGCLAALAEQVRDALPELSRRIDRNVASCSWDNQSLLETFGHELWQPAARCLAAASPAPDWTTQTGLSAADHAALSATVAALLACAPSVGRLAARAECGVAPDPVELEAIMTATAEQRPSAASTMMALLMSRLPNPGHVVRAVGNLSSTMGDGAAKAIAERALNFMLDRIEQTPPFGSNIALAMDDLRLMAGLLIDLQEQPTAAFASRARVEQLRKQVDEACRSRFQASLTTSLLDKVADLPSSRDPTWDKLEQSMRELRRFTNIARRVGSTDHYDKLLMASSDALRPKPGGSRESDIQRMRLIEILCGSDRAAAAIATQ